MKIAITARGPAIEADIDYCFGRAYWFLIFDLDNKEWFAVDNNDIRNSISNAGQMAAELLKDHDVSILLTGETGPKAFRFLTGAGITVFHGATGSATDTLELWSQNKLHPADKASGPGSPFCLTERAEPKAFHPAEPKLTLAGIHTVGGTL